MHVLTNMFRFLTSSKVLAAVVFCSYLLLHLCRFSHLFSYTRLLSFCTTRLRVAQEDALSLHSSLGSLRNEKRRLEDELSVTRNLASSHTSLVEDG